MPKMKSSSGQADLVELALAGIDVQIKALTEKREELRKMLAPAPATKARKAVKRRKKAAPAKKAKGVAPAKKVAAAAPAKKTRVFSAATRRKLKEAAKARWARQKAAAKAE